MPWLPPKELRRQEGGLCALLGGSRRPEFRSQLLWANAGCLEGMVTPTRDLGPEWTALPFKFDDYGLAICTVLHELLQGKGDPSRTLLCCRCTSRRRSRKLAMV